MGLLAFDLKDLNFGLQFERLVGLCRCLALVAGVLIGMNYNWRFFMILIGIPGGIFINPKASANFSP